jgi:hypothetical protein
MNQRIPFFSAREINSVDDYERLFHLKSYIKEKSGRFEYDRKKNPVLLDLMKKSGYAKYQKFQTHRKCWENLERNIPLAYLKAIGGDIDTIRQIFKTDVEEYDRALKVALFPKYWTVRIFAAMYQSRKFPPNIAEDEAIEFLKTFSAEKKLRCCINYPSIKTIWIEDFGKEVKYSYYRPAIKFTKNMLILSNDGSGIGVSTL